MSPKLSIALGLLLVGGLAFVIFENSRKTSNPGRYTSRVKLMQSYMIHALPRDLMYEGWHSRADFEQDLSEFQNTEMESLISMDILERVATAVGPERIRDGLSQSDASEAAREIKSRIKVNRMSPFIIEIQFEHRSRDLPVMVLNTLVEENMRIREEDSIRRERRDLEIIRGERTVNRPRSAREAVMEHCNPGLLILGKPSEPIVETGDVE